MIQLLALVVSILLILLWHPAWLLTLAAIGGLTYLLAWLFGVIASSNKP